MTIEELEADVRGAIEAVKNGDTITVTADGEELVNLQAEPPWIIPPREPGRFQDVELGPPLNLDFDPVDWLIEDRDSEMKKHGI